MLETKVLLMSLAQHAALSKSPRQIYSIIRKMAQVEGMDFPGFDEMKAELEEADEKD